jgi:hypothetical protein
MPEADAQAYLKNTEAAVRHLLTGIDQYEGLLRGLVPPSRARTKDEVAWYMAAAEAYFGCEFPEATLSAAILQVAFTAFLLFSQNDVIPDDCTALVGPTNTKAIRFCVGRRIHGIPAGLLVYAGRNQSSHWDDETFDFPTSQVFGSLLAAHYDNPLFDLAYELNWPGRTLKAHHIVLGELRWTSYEAYEADVRGALGIE